MQKEKLDFEAKLDNPTKINDLITRYKCYICSPNELANGYMFPQSTLDKMKNSILGTAVVAAFIGDNNDGSRFGGHEDGLTKNQNGMTIRSPMPIGVGFADPYLEPWMEEYKGRQFLTCYIYLWTGRYQGLNTIPERTIYQSMEVCTDDEQKDGYKLVNDALVLGLCLLEGGDGGVQPAFDDATIVPFSRNDVQLDINKMKKEFAEMMNNISDKYKSLNFKIPQKVKDNAKEGLELHKKYKRGGTSVGLATANYLINNDVVSPDKVRHIAKYFPRHSGDNLDENGKNDKPVSNGFIAWCLSADSKILMADGNFKTAKEICEKHITDKVISYNTMTNKFEEKKIINWFINPSEPKDFYVIGKNKQNHRGVFNDTKLIITGEHPFYSNNQWIPAKDMKNKNLNSIHYCLDDIGMQIIYGSILGDGCIAKDGRYAEGHGIVQKDYILEKKRILKNLNIRDYIYIPKCGYSKGKQEIQIRSSVCQFLKDIRDELYIDNKKTINLNFLNKINNIGIAIWIADDGHLHYNKKNNNSYNYRLHIEGFDKKSANIIKEYFINKGYNCNLIKRENCDGYCLYFTQEASRNLGKNIAKYMPISMKYKIPLEFKEINYELKDYVSNLKYYLSEEQVTKHLNLTEYKDRHSIQPKKHSLKYNFTVEDNNNYFANGFLVHNCLWGGDEAWKWSQDLVDSMNKIDKKEKERKTEENFDKNELGSGDYSIKINKSKEAMSNTSWGNVDKTSQLHKVIKAKNVKTVVDDIFALVEADWENAPSKHLKYPIMEVKSDNEAVYNRGALKSALGYAKAQNETTVISKLVKIYKDLELNKENAKEFDFSYEEYDVMFSDDKANMSKDQNNSTEEIINNDNTIIKEDKNNMSKSFAKKEMLEKMSKCLEECKYTKDDKEMCKYSVVSYDNENIYAIDKENCKMSAIPYSVDGEDIKPDCGNCKCAKLICGVYSDDGEDNEDSDVMMALNQKFTTDENIEGLANIARSKDETEADKKKIAEMEAKIQKMEEDYNKLKCSYDEMSKLKCDFENKNNDLQVKMSKLETDKKNTIINNAIEEIKGLVPEGDIEKLQNKVNDFSKIEDWVEHTQAFAFKYIKENPTRLPLNGDFQKIDPNDIWGKDISKDDTWNIENK